MERWEGKPHVENIISAGFGRYLDRIQAAGQRIRRSLNLRNPFDEISSEYGSQPEADEGVVSKIAKEFSPCRKDDPTGIIEIGYYSEPHDMDKITKNLWKNAHTSQGHRVDWVLQQEKFHNRFLETRSKSNQPEDKIS